MADQITDNDFEEKVLGSKIPVLVDFWAPWCGPCKMAAPAIDELSEKYKGKVLVVKLNVDENQQSASKYNVMSIPTTILFKDGKEGNRQTGFSGIEAFEKLIMEAL